MVHCVKWFVTEFQINLQEISGSSCMIYVWFLHDLRRYGRNLSFTQF